MTALKALLDEHGVSQAALAKEIGVSTAAVSQWCSGDRPIPIGRIAQITEMLGVSEVALSKQEAALEFIPTTILAWMLMDGGMLSHIGTDWRDRLGIVAEMLEVSWRDVANWGAGGGMPLDAAKLFMDVYLPGVNPVVLVPMVADNRLSEALAVRKTVKDALEDGTFADLAQRVQAERLAWESLTLVEVQSVLDDGRAVHPIIRDWRRAPIEQRVSVS